MTTTGACDQIGACMGGGWGDGPGGQHPHIACKLPSLRVIFLRFLTLRIDDLLGEPEAEIT